MSELESSNQLTIGLMYFSPTGGTKKVCETIASSISTKKPVVWDLTKPTFLADKIPKADLWIVGGPVYEYRLAKIARERLNAALENDDFSQTAAVAVVSYANVSPGIALRQLVKILKEKTFRVLGAGQFIAEGTFAHLIVGYHYGEGRPDSSDIDIARKFGHEILEKGSSGPEIDFEKMNSVKEHFPFSAKLGEGMAKRVTGPIMVDRNKCTSCGLCIDACPVDCLNHQTFTKQDSSKCISCMACIKACPVQARTQIAKLQTLAKIQLKPQTMRNEPKYFV